MQNDRLVKIYVAETEKPFLIQQKLLERTSDYFVKAFKNEGLGKDAESGVLRFPDDKPEAWECLISWMFRQKTPEQVHFDDAELAIRCWALGDKYIIPDFQDEAMLHLLWYVDTEHLSGEEIKLGVLNSPPDSLLRTLMAEECAREYDNTVGMKDLVCLDGIGFLAEFFEAYRQLQEDVDCFDNRLEMRMMSGNNS